MKKYLILFILGSIAYSNSFNFQENDEEIFNKLLSYESYDNIYGFEITINFCSEEYICPPGFSLPNSGINSLELNSSLLEIDEWIIAFNNYSGTTKIVGINTTMQNPISAGCGIIAEFEQLGNIHTVEGLFAGQGGVDLSFYFNNFLEIDYNSECSLILGDLNNDGILNIIDIVALVYLVLDDQFNTQGDINSDSFINVVDIVALVHLILNENIELGCNDIDAINYNEYDNNDDLCVYDLCEHYIQENNELYPCDTSENNNIYEVGDQLSCDDADDILNICYPNDCDYQFSLSNLYGKVTWIEMTASW